MSHVAQLFEGRRALACGRPDEDIDAVLGELVDSVLCSCHRQSQRHLPDVAKLREGLRDEERGSLVNWLVQACDAMGFHEAVLYHTVLTLDRYCAFSREPFVAGRMQKVVMAVMCLILKTHSVQDEVCNLPLRDQLSYLCRQQVSFQDILAMEYQVFQALRFQVCAPSPLDFLDALSAPLSLPAAENAEGAPAAGSAPRCIANFLLQLSLFRAPLHYHYPHAILAAAAIYVALCSHKAAPELYRVLLEDVALACSEVGASAADSVAACAGQLLRLWHEFAASQGTLVPSVMRKFSGVWLTEAMMLTPPPASSLPLPVALGAPVGEGSRSSSPGQRRLHRC